MSQSEGYCRQIFLSVLKLIPDHDNIDASQVREVTCTADGQPSPTVTWLQHDGAESTEFDNGGLFQEKSPGQSILHVKNAKLNDEGRYSCYVNNISTHGNDTRNKNLYLAGAANVSYILRIVRKRLYRDREFV